MTRIILRLNRNAPVTTSADVSPAANGGESTSDAINNGTSSSYSPPPKTPPPPPKEQEETTECAFNTHQTGLISDGDADLPHWSQNKRPRNKLSGAHVIPPPSPSSAAASRKSMDPPAFTGNRNSKDAKMGSSSGSPSPKKQDDLNRPILRSMARKRLKSAAQETDSKKVSYLGGSIKKDKSTEPTLRNGRAEAENRSKAGGQVLEWPKFHIELSIQEKEDDFLQIKGTKLPLKPKKRSKATEKAIENCYPGMPLLELTRKRYEIRKQKSGKKQKPRGLKGMDMMDIDSD